MPQRYVKAKCVRDQPMNAGVDQSEAYDWLNVGSLIASWQQEYYPFHAAQIEGKSTIRC